MEDYNNRPVGQLNPNFGLLKYILLSIVTFGIYAFFFHSKMSSDLNILASRHDGRRTLNGALVYLLLSWLTFGIVPIVWEHKISGRMGRELDRRRAPYNISSLDYWLWNILGSLIIIGPFIYIHKKCEAMNVLIRDYNNLG